ncbi:MAG: PEGA domain-containing protein [candidate division Zixibacteria bacterium]|nr:PEGA domain-containing protein [candidate division Zixibacteria bacterium]
MKKTFGIAVGILFIAAGVTAQTSPAGNLTVRSNPPGADVLVRGEASATGITPVTFQYPLVGSYELKIQKHGFETYKTRMALDPAKQMVVDVRLSPKTRFKAAARSVFIPGWGQRYSEQKTKGFLLQLMAAGAVTAFLVTDHDFNNKFDRFESLQAEYDSALTAGAGYGEMQSRWNGLYDAQKKAYDAENARRISIGSVVAVWTIGVLDALLFTPEEKATFSVKGVALEPASGSKTFGLRLTKSF